MKKFKKILTFIILTLIQMGILTGITFANEIKWDSLTGSQILVSERPLGAKNCKCATITVNPNSNERTLKIGADMEEWKFVCEWQDISKRLYVCETGTIQELIQGIVQWIIQIALLLGVLATAALGVAWSMAGADNPEYKKKLKDWLIGLIVGLILIYGFQYILGIFGWVYKTTI